MACHWMKMPNGTVAHLNIAKRPKRRCKFCTLGMEEVLCDFPVPSGRRSFELTTCDAPMCQRCATSVGNNRDFCPTHKDKDPKNPDAPPAEQGSLSF